MSDKSNIVRPLPGCNRGVGFETHMGTYIAGCTFVCITYIYIESELGWGLTNISESVGNHVKYKWCRDVTLTTVG